MQERLQCLPERQETEVRIPPRSPKRLFVIVLGATCGVVLGISAVLGVVLWYTSRPQPPEAWDPSSIVAKYDYVSTEPSDNTFVFYYVLQNNTAEDYRLESDDRESMVLMSLLENEKSLASDGSDLLTIDLPLFIPANQRLRVEIHVKYPFDEALPEGATDEQREAYQARLRSFLNDRMGNLTGFSLYDQRKRYQILFPKGW